MWPVGNFISSTLLPHRSLVDSRDESSELIVAVDDKGHNNSTFSLEDGSIK